MEEEVIEAENQFLVASESAGNITDAATSAGKDFVQQTSTFFNWIKSYLTWNNLFKILGVLLICFAIWGIYKLLVHVVKKIPKEKVSKQTSNIILRVLKYVYYVAIVMFVLGQFGVKLSAVWGAAGIAGVAIGFAAQTSVSNIISGIFVLTEKAIKTGDVIVIDDITGVVDSVNLLSVRVHTFDNQMVRIPNSTIINSNLTNNSYHSDRRLTIDVSVSYDTDMTKALEVLLTAPALCPHVLKNPAPAAWFDSFGESGINLTLAVWYKFEDLITAKNEAYIAIKKVFDEAGIEIPFNQVEISFPQKSGKPLKIDNK